ncbi:MAG: DUF3352 domain-containing protein [Cyanobacteria bacterium P01_D01_bin.156]
MINRWGTAGFILAVLATPLAAQELSLEPSMTESAEPSSDISEPQSVPTDVSAPDTHDENTTDDSFEDWSIEPAIDVTDLRTSLEALLPKAAPSPPKITSILPSNTPAAMIVNTREEAWATLKQYTLFSQLSEGFGVEPSPQALPLLPIGMDYTEDVQPWIGESIAFALLPVPSVRTINPVERSVTIVPIESAIEFFDFIPTLAEVRGALPEQLSYRTFPIWHWPEEFVPYDDSWEDWESFPEEDFELEEVPSDTATGLTSQLSATRSYRQPEPPYIYIPDPNNTYSDEGYTIPGYAIAHLGNYMLMAQNVDSLRQWIEFQTQDAPKLSSNSSFEKTQNHPQAQNSLATVYGNIGELLNFEFSDPFQEFGLPPIPQPNLRERAAMSALFSQVTFDALIYPDTQGMHLEAHLYTEGALPTLPPSPNADHSILNLIPAATYVMGSGYDISGFWNDVSSAFSLSDISGGLLETARSIVSLATGLDLDTDILGWMDGEYSLFLFPSRSGLLNSFFPNLGLEAGVILETSNRPAAETALEALDDVIGEDAVIPITVADSPVVNWQYDIDLDGAMDSVLAHTWITEDTLAFTTGTGAMERLVVPAGFNPLNNHSTFRNATDSFPKPNNGYFYINMGSTLSFFYTLFDFHQATDPWAVDVRRYLGTVRSLSLTTASSAQQFQIDLLLGLAASTPKEESVTEDNTEVQESLILPQ